MLWAKVCYIVYLNTKKAEGIHMIMSPRWRYHIQEFTCNKISPTWRCHPCKKYPLQNMLIAKDVTCKEMSLARRCHLQGVSYMEMSPA